MKVGYARVSTSDQNLYTQEDALRSDGCEEIYTEVASGAKTDRPGLERALSYLRKGDTLVVLKLDRLGRSLKHLIQLIEQLNERGIGFKSLRESIDTTTTGGKLVFHIFSALAEFERDLIRDRTNAGLKAARARGRLGGRPPVLEKRQIKRMTEMYKDGKNTVEEISKIFGVKRQTIYNYLNKEKLEIEQSS